MKHFSLVVLLMYASCRTSDGKKFSITTEKHHKVDTVAAGQVLTFPVIVDNPTNTDVVVENITKSCNCTSISLQKGTISKAKSKNSYTANINTDSSYKGTKTSVVISFKTNTNPAICSLEKIFYVKQI